MKAVALTVLILPFFLSSCAWDPFGTKAMQAGLDKMEADRAAYEASKIKEKEDFQNYLKNQQMKKSQFEKLHPEVPVEKLSLAGVKDKKSINIFNALNSLPLVTRNPNTKDANEIYVNAGGYKLTLQRVMLAAEAWGAECRRSSAYIERDLSDYCADAFAKGIMNFSAAVKKNQFDRKGISTAIGEASSGNFIDFDHAAGLINMHSNLCKKQNNTGYVALITRAAPCDGQGDVLTIDAAEKMGFIR